MGWTTPPNATSVPCEFEQQNDQRYTLSRLSRWLSGYRAPGSSIDQEVRDAGSTYRLLDNFFLLHVSAKGNHSFLRIQSLLATGY